MSTTGNSSSNSKETESQDDSLEDFATFNHEIDLSDETDNIMTLNADAICVQDSDGGSGGLDHDIGLVEDDEDEVDIDDHGEVEEEEEELSPTAENEHRQESVPASRFVPIA